MNERSNERPDLAPSLQRSISLNRRIAAVVALAAWAVAAGFVLGFLFRNLGHLVLGFAGLLVAVAGGWVTITERGGRAVGGALVCGLGLGFVLLSVTAAFDGLGPIVGSVLLVGGLLLTGLWAGQLALRRELHHADLARPHERTPPAHPVLLCNPWSGGGKVESFDVVRLAEERGVECVVLEGGDDLAQLARDAVARGADCLGMAGGDGSQAMVAAVAIEHDVPFVVVPAGTRNHLALDLGLDRDDPRGALAAFGDGIERFIDYGTANDRLFVNNVSLGLYAAIVQDPAYRDDKLRTTAQLLPDLLGSQSEPTDLRFTGPHGREVDGAYLVQVSNNPYSGRALDLGQRLRLDTGKLGVVALSAPRGVDVAWLVALAATNRLDRSEHYLEWTTRELTVHAASGRIDAGVDGEAVTLTSPLRLRSHPLGLRLLVPEDNVMMAEWRRSRDVRVAKLVEVALGRESDR